jgi:hypothetical protein
MEPLSFMAMCTKTKQLVPIVRQINSVCIAKLYLFEINFNIIYPSIIRCTFVVFDQNLVLISDPAVAFNMSKPSCPPLIAQQKYR